MGLKLLKLKQSEFNKLNCDILFESKDFDRQFAVISDGLNNFKMGWSSDCIDPDIIEICNGYVFIGIDQHICIIDFNNNTISVNLELDSLFIEAKLYDDCIVMVFELEVIKIDTETFNTIKHYDLPDIAQDIIFGSSKVDISCFDGSSVVVDIN